MIPGMTVKQYYDLVAAVFNHEDARQFGGYNDPQGMIAHNVELTVRILHKLGKLKHE